MSAIGQTAGMIGHDIRNPLQSIMGEIYLSKSDVDSLPDCDAKKDLKERQKGRNVKLLLILGLAPALWARKSGVIAGMRRWSQDRVPEERHEGLQDLRLPAPRAHGVAPPGARSRRQARHTVRLVAATGLLTTSCKP